MHLDQLPKYMIISLLIHVHMITSQPISYSLPHDISSTHSFFTDDFSKNALSLQVIDEIGNDFGEDQ